MTELPDRADENLRPIRPGRRRRNALRTIGNTVYLAIFGFLFVVAVVVGVGGVLSAAQRTYWGTFTVQSCESGFRGRCEGVGTWVSDDGSITKRHIQLDGDVGSNGTVRASFTPTGFNNDAENNIVHTPFWSSARLWIPWAMAVVFGGFFAERVVAVRRRRQEVLDSGMHRRAHSSP